MYTCEAKLHWSLLNWKKIKVNICKKCKKIAIKKKLERWVGVESKRKGPLSQVVATRGIL